MNGFFISNIVDKSILKKESEIYFLENFVHNDILWQRHTINKFLEDKPFLCEEGYAFVGEGVILNKRDLMNEKGCKNSKSLVDYFVNTPEFFRELRGPFSGAFSIEKDEIIAYTSQIGDGPVFYFCNGKQFIISSSITWIVNCLKKANIDFNLDESAAYQMLTYGFMCDESTIVKEIKRVRAGTYIIVSTKNGSYSVKCNRYHQFSNRKEFDNNISEEELIEQLDKKFQKAIDLEYQKDDEYGYKHLTTLSGGLDSRMNLWVAKDRNPTCITFAQNDSLDETISRQITEDLQLPWIFKSLSDAKFLYDIKKVSLNNFGLLSAMGQVHGCSIYKALNPKEFGLMHTGQVGDSIISTKFENKRAVSGAIIGANSSKFLDRLDTTHIYQYENDEQYFLYCRAFQGACGGHFALGEFFPVVSPFLDVDFIEFCLKIPIKYRKNHRIYFSWIKNKYSDARKYKWETTWAKIDANKIVLMIQKIRKIGLVKLCNRGLKKIGIGYQIKTGSKRDMNPTEYWWHKKEWIRDFLNDLIISNIENRCINSSLKQDIKDLYQQGNLIEKVQVATLLCIVAEYFEERNIK